MIEDVFTAQRILTELVEELHEMLAIGEITTAKEVIDYVSNKEQEAARRASELLEELYKLTP